MAILEFEFKGIDQNFRSSAANVLKDIDKIKSAFGGIGGGSVDVSGLKKGMDEVRASIKLAESDNKMFLATKLADTRQAGIEELNAIRSVETQKQQAYRTTGEAWKAQREQEKNIGVGLDNSFKETRNSIAKLNEEQKRYNATQRETRDALKAVSSERPYTQLTAEMNRVRKEAQDLGAQMIRLEMAGDKTSAEYIQLATAFKTAQQSLNPLDTAVKKLDGTLGQHQRNVGNYQQTQSGANGVTMEFNRIIQDAPFGMMGIGNNIQQLAANWQHYAQQQRTAADGTKIAVSNMSLMKGAISSLFAPANLLTLGIATITSAWTYYTMSQQKANKVTKEAKDELDKYVESLSSLNSALLKGEQNSEKELTRLNILKKVYEDSNATLTQRKNAYNEVISMYEGYFGKLSDEEKRVGSLEIYYNKLTKAIIQTAKARALEDEVTDNNKKLRALEKKAKREKEIYNTPLDKQNELDLLINLRLKEKDPKKQEELMNQINQLQDSWDDSFFGTKKDKDIANSNRALSDWKKTSQQIYDIREDNKSIEEEIYNTIKDGAVISTSVAGINNKSTANTTKNIKDQRDYLLEIQQILQNSQGRVDTGGEILDWDKELIKVHNYYDSQTIALDKMLVSSQRAYKNDSAKRLQIEQAVSSTKITLHNNMINELSKIDDKYFNQGKDLINELISAYGEQPIESALDKELKKNKLDFSKKREQAIELKVSQDDLDLLNKLERDEDKNIKIKFSIQYLEEIDKLEKQIQDLVDKPFSTKNKDGLIKQTEERKKEVQALYDVLVQVMKLGYDGKGTGGFKLSEEDIQKTAESLKLQIETNAKKQSDDKKEKDIQDYTNILKSGVDSVFTNLKSNIDEFGWKAESVFYSLGETVGDMLKQVANKNTAKFMEKLTEGAKDFKGLADNFSDMWKKDKPMVISAGLGYAGGVVQGFGGAAGNIVGGGLSGAAAGLSAGAATGAAGGGAYGAVIGAVVGMTAGILKEAKNRRQEKILIQQMEEQKKANRLLERLSALTYASQIIGQKTEYGIVSGVRRNEFGQIVSVVQGQDIIMVADRANNKKQR